MRGTGGHEVNDDNPGQADSDRRGAAGSSDPCTLVSKAQAQSILGSPIAAPQEAPLGPTCIYQPRGAGSFITVAVEPVDFLKVKSQIRARRKEDIKGITAYCGHYGPSGQSMTFVPLAGGRVLNVTAPCSVGAQFAANALPRLPS